MLSTAPLRSSREKCPYRFAMSTIVDELQPAILATLAIGIPAFSIRETAVCLRSWKRQANGQPLLGYVPTPAFRAQYGQPQADSSSSAFGQIISTVNTTPIGTGTPREIQCALRLEF